MKSEKIRQSDKPLAITIFAVGASMYYLSYFFRESKYNIFASSTETLPRICAALIMLFSVLLFIRSVRCDRKAKERISGIIEQLKEDKSVYIMFAMTAIYIFLFSRLGFIVSTFLYTNGAAFILGRKKVKWYIIVIIALAVSVGSYFFFAVLLKVIVPSGILI